MIVIVAITIAAGAVLLWSLYSEQVAPPVRRTGRRWAGLPGPADVRRRDFPLVVAGYDPRSVDAHLRAVADAVSHMRARLAAVEGDPVPGVEPAAAPGVEPAAAPPVTPAALRAEQVLPPPAATLPAPASAAAIPVKPAPPAPAATTTARPSDDEAARGG